MNDEAPASKPPMTSLPPAVTGPRAITSPSQVCDRHDFAGHPAGDTCAECGHMIMAHVGTESCVICRTEYQLSPNYRRLQQRIHGVHPRDIW